MFRVIVLLTFILAQFVNYAQTGEKGSAFASLDQETGKTHVIAIGVAQYDVYPNLNYSDDDATLIQSYYGQKENTVIKTFIDSSKLVPSSLLKEIRNTLLFEAVSGDNVLIFFSGHGDVDTVSNAGHLILPKAHHPSSRAYDFNTTIPMNQLSELLDQGIKRGVNVILVTDACRSGHILYARQVNQELLKLAGSSASIVSCGPNESSYESSNLENGIFTFYLVQGMKGLADQNNDQKVSFLELRNYLETNVSAFAQAEKNASQNPSIEVTDKTKTISKVDSNSLAQAKSKEKEIEKKQFNSTRNKNDLALSKGLSPTMSLSQNSSYLLNLMQELVSKQIIFPDEIVSSDKDAIVAGSSQMLSVSSSPVYSLSSSSDGSYIAAPSNNDIAIYLKDMSLWKKLKGHNGGVTAVSFRPGTSELVSGSWDNSVILWDAVKGVKLKTLKKISDEAYGICFIDNDNALIGTNKGDLYKWNLKTDISTSINLGKSRISDLVLAGDKVFVAMGDGTIRIVDPITLKQIKSISANKGGVHGICFNSIKKEVLSVGADKNLMIWNSSTFDLIKTVGLDFNDNRDIDIDPFGTYAFVSSRRYDMDVIDLSSGYTYSHFLSSNSSGLVSVHFNQSDGNVLVGDSKGRMHKHAVSINKTDFAALTVYEILLKSSDVPHYKYLFDGTIMEGLNREISEVLNPLVNGEAILPSIDDIIKAKRYANKVLEIGGLLPYEKKKSEINLLLLEVFEVLLKQDNTQYEAALNKIKRVEQLDPNGAYALNISGNLLARLDKLAEAKKKAGQCEELAPLWAEAPCGTGKILFQEGNYSEAEKKFRETIQKGEDLSKGYYNLAKLFNHLGRLTEASNLIDQARKIDQNVLEIDLIAIENAYLRGDYSEVKQLTAQDYMRTVPDGIIAGLDVEFLERGQNTQYESLYNSYKNAYELDSSNISAINGLAYFYLRLMKDDKANKFVESTFSAEDNGRAIKGNAVLKRECKRLFNKAERVDKLNLHASIGDWMTRGTPVETQSVTSLIQRHKGSAFACAAVGRYYIHLEDYKNALKYLKLGLKADPDNVRANILFLEANKLLGKEKKNATLLSSLQGDSNKSDLLKYRKELTKYFLLY